MRSPIRAPRSATASEAGPAVPAKSPAIRELLRGQRVQAKLRIGAPDDPAEQEADRVADQVMRMPAGEEEEETVQMMPSGGSSATQASDGATAAITALKGGGTPLSAVERAFFEPRFGTALSDIRVHDGPAADAAARGIGARAFALGKDIAFAAGERRGDHDGRRVMAHELTHTLQQRRASPYIQRLLRTPYPWRGVITPARGANLRSTNSAANPATILYAIPRGQPVQVLSATGNWLRVRSTYKGPAVTGWIYHTLVDDATSRSMQQSVGTTMVWRPSGPGSGTDFQIWASAASETTFTVTATTVMNCWEAVLLSAYRAGSISWNWIHNLYTVVPVADWVATMSRGARHSYPIPHPGPPARMPQRGDLVFFDGLAHVALATGRGSEVYTFWPPPDTPFTPGGTTDRVKVVTIEALNTWRVGRGHPAFTVEFAAPSWR